MHDWGGAIGMAWAARNAERVARLILFNTAAFTMPPGKRMPWQLRLARTPPIGAIAVRGFNAFVRGTLEVALTDGADERVRRAYLAPHDSWANRIATLRFVQDIPLSPSDLSYPLLIEAEKGIELFRDRPALICWGGRDFVFDRVFFDRWRGLLPDAETHWFENAGHLVLEDASEQIRSIVRRFLTAHPLEGAPG
jgi:haloalkane dehalogenase